MFRVGCSDIGIESCDFAAEGEKVHKVEDVMLEHLRDVHPAMVVGLNFEQHKELETRIRSAMHGLETGAAPHEVDKHLMLSVSCRDLGVEGCDFAAEDLKVRRVEEKLFDHIRGVHPEIVTGLTWKEYSAFEHRVKAAVHHQ
jgi:predicted small metal-binding protein